MQEGVMDQTTVTKEPEGATQEPEKTLPPVKRKKRRKKAPIIAAIVIVALVGGLLWLFLGQGEKAPDEEILTDIVVRSSISSVIEGNGLARAKDSESIIVSTKGTVLDVYVREGDFVAEGTLLYLIDSPDAEDAINNAQNNVNGYNRQLRTLYEARQNLTIKTEFSGKLIDVIELSVGDYVNSGQVICRLVDDSKLNLTQYYSYAYEHDIYLGQTASVSIPGAMQQMNGSVTEITKVERIAPEGSKLFSVVITVDNPGTLTEGLSASATINANGEQIGPYELGKLEYYRDTEVKSKVTGEVEYVNLQDYLTVSAGTALVRVDGDDIENEIFQLEESLRRAQEDLQTAQENKEKLRGVAPIDGTVVGLAITPGQEITASTTVISITDVTEIIVEADIDERMISFLEVGMMVEIDQWGYVTYGMIDSISLSGKYENGMSTFPTTILVDNTDDNLNSYSSVVYRIYASESEDCLVIPTQCVKSVVHPETGEPINVVFVRSDAPPEEALDIDGSALGVPANGYYAVPVTIGISDSYNVEIIDGVEEGTEVFSQVMRESSWYYY